ncbi:MAG: mandelate racemase/muconate lactonizing enzyme family protein, partial [Chloroflexota bacterium]
MKVTGVKPWIVKVDWTNAPGQTEGAAAHMREFVFVQVDTDEGITGWGEITTYPGFVANRAIAAMTREMASLVVDEDPAYIERIWNKVFRAMTYAGTRGASCAVLSAIDIALWDIRGKALGLPVYMLLGGAVRDRIALYTHPPRTADPAKA